MIALADAAATEAWGAALAPLIRAGDVVALSGALGAGKTTLARGVLRGLGFDGEVASPTFPIVIPYDRLDPPLWHVDLYRIESSAALEQLALDEARGEAALLIEWPERLGDDLWPDSLTLRLDSAAAGGRSLTANVPTVWKDRWPV